jgi:uncharacterized metal-binding protein YceD (DUF177 family)
MIDAAAPRPTRFRTGGLSPRKPTRFRYEPDADAREVLAREIGLLGLKALVLDGEIRPSGRDELVLSARLVAQADQACVVTLAPVPARIDQTVTRRYVAGMTTPEGDEAEMPEDDSVEPLPEVIDLTEIAAEALALALPEYPRAPGAELGMAVHAAAGVKPITDDDLKPFSGLAGLADRLGGNAKGGTEDDE